MGRTVRELKARAAAAAALLEDEQGKPSHSLMSGFQADAVIMLIREADKMPADELAAIGVLIASAPFTQSDISRICDRAPRWMRVSAEEAESLSGFPLVASLRQ